MSISASLRKKEGVVKYIAFWGHDHQNGEFSQWFASPFTFTINAVHTNLLKSLADILKAHNTGIDLDIISGKQFSTAEHFMMAGKAILFDVSCLDNILIASTPKQVKFAGRKVKNFNQAVWDSVNTVWVAIGNYLKFTQHINLRALLKSTGTDILIEASPLDKIWGVGLPPSSALLKTPSKWQGENRLGDALMMVRTLL
jgi:ribA/ribD-fused uncharacterized protein